MRNRFMTYFLSVALLTVPIETAGADTPVLQKQFDETVKPFVSKYCFACHSGAQPTAQFDLKSFSEISQIRDDFGRWSLLANRLTAHEMPPKMARAQPSDAERQGVIDFVRAVRTDEVKRLGGDPGLVLARRLSNAEYDYTIRDLTGQDMQVARQFPVDPANQAGFDNSGESLSMSQAMVSKYLQAARQVADHAVFLPHGIEFAPYLMSSETDRNKYAIQRIMAFYKAQPTDFADYFEASWRYRYRRALGDAGATLNSTAERMHISAKYLPKVWSILNEKPAIGPLASLQARWNSLPVPNAGADKKVKTETALMRDFVVRVRAHTAKQFDAPIVKGLRGQSPPLHIWRLQQYATHHRDSDPDVLRQEGVAEVPPLPIPNYPDYGDDATPHWRIVMAHARFGDPDLVYPAGKKAEYQKAFEHFAQVFPDAFMVTERGRFWPDVSTDKGRFLSAGYHVRGGYYRDDTALMQLILDRKAQDQLNALWNEFDFVADQTAQTWSEFFLTGREFMGQDGHFHGGSFARSQNRPITSSASIRGVRDQFMAVSSADPTKDPIAEPAIRDYFDGIDATLRHIERERSASEPRHLAAVLAFAERAWRRPLTTSERLDMQAYYKTLRIKNRLSHENAIRDSIVSVLMAPDFLYRFDLGIARLARATSKAPQMGYFSQPLADYSLASRLSYFLWASMPDQELLRHAASGDLHRPEVLTAQARRMLKDPRVKGLATEFTGNWLGFRQFETNNSVDRARFPTFDDNLREAMFQEPIHFVLNNIQQDASVLDFLYGDYTFVDPALAKHYGMPEVAGDADTWARVDNAGKYGRGGILPMAVFMTAYSPGLRTSPVKRGHWVVQKVLGIRVPPPPPVVPELPSDEAKTDKPIREMLAEHHKNPYCAGCHLRFDAFGLVFEGYGPVGNARTVDLAGRPIDASATFPGDFNAVGLAGLQNFIRDHRQDNFTDNLSRKLLAYALNRSLQLSDDALIDRMKTKLAAEGFRFRALVETIIASPQFLNRRAIETADVRKPNQSAGGKPIKIDFQQGNRP